MLAMTEPGFAPEALRQILDHSGAVAFLKDREGRYVLVNREFEQVAGRPAEEVLGHRDDELFPPELAMRLRHNDLKVLHELKSFQFEESGPFAGQERTFLTSKFPLLAEDGTVYAICGLATDITERKRLEDALHQAALVVSSPDQDAVFRELVRALAALLKVDGAFIAVPDSECSGRLTMLALYIDGTLRESFDYPLNGTPCETVIGHGFRLYPWQLQELFPLDSDFRALGINAYAGYPLTDAAGHSLGLIAVISRQRFAAAGLVESILQIFSVRATSEIERRRSFASLQASEANYRAIFAATEDAVFVHDWDTGAIVDANPQACRAYGYSREEFRGLSVGDLSSGIPPYTEAHAARLIQEARTGRDVRTQWHRRNRDGSLHWDDVTLKRVEIDGRPAILAFTRDITDRVRAEAERSELEAQLRQAQKMEAIGQLTGGIAHDFNNLLTSILGYVVMTRERVAATGDTAATGFLEQAQLSCERARDLIQQMLTFSRGRRGEPRPVELGGLVNQTLRLLRASLPASVEIESATEPAPALVLADPVHLEQVLFNLCLNARDAMDGPGVIRVNQRTGEAEGVCASCRRRVSGRQVELSVQDSGSGIRGEVLDRMFEPFFTTKEVGKGSGMGLAIVHGIVHEQGGHILVDSMPGQGSRFRILLPALAAGTGEQDAGAARDVPAAGNPLALSGRILVVDDEPVVGRYMRDLLTSHGLTASHVGSAAAALEAIRSAPQAFDVVITDQTMPRCSGLELAREIGRIRPGLPVLLYSGYSDALDADPLAGTGIHGFLKKPVDVAELLGLLGPLLPRR